MMQEQSLIVNLSKTMVAQSGEDKG